MIPDLGTIVAALHDSEINGEVSWFYDSVWRVRLGDVANGIDAEAIVSSPSEAAEWLRANAVRRYPASEFAKLFPRTGTAQLSPTMVEARHSEPRTRAANDP
jgi:hypothetical protein